MDNPELETILNGFRDRIVNLEKRIDGAIPSIQQVKKELVTKDVIVSVAYGEGESKSVMSVFIKPQGDVKLNGIQVMFVLPEGE